MRAGKGADRPSVLAINPRNREASAERRTKLLAAFDALDEDTRADLLEEAETMTYSVPGSEARRILRLMYVTAGWETP
jgi:hypothetical protein